MNPCCVTGCDEKDARHERVFTLSANGWGEIETTSHFCCVHVDRLNSDEKPILDLRVHGEERA